jgi:hypothetical protein
MARFKSKESREGLMTIQDTHVHELRRFLPRQFADWGGIYRLDTDSNGRWRDCRVIDICSAGAGLELLDAPADVVIGGQILVAVQLEGEIRNARMTKDGHLRVGTQFVNLTDAERLFLESQEKLAVHW